MLNYAKAKGYLNEDLTHLEKWVSETKELSNGSLKRTLEEVPDKVLEKAIRWSEMVNRSVAAIPEEEKAAFAGVKEILETVHKKADIVVVSAANADAIATEWEYNHLLDKVDVCMGQECGSKAACIHQLLELGYEKDCVIMLGDAVGDYQSACANGILFYPIQVSKEAESWRIFGDKVFPQFAANQYTKEEMEVYVKEFYENLGGEKEQ